MPRPVYFFLSSRSLFSLGYWVLMPAWPLGVDLHQGPARHRPAQRPSPESLKQAALDRSAWTKQIEAKSYQRRSKPIRADDHRAPDRPHAVRRQLRGVPWRDAKGGHGFPNLTTTSWLWGGDAGSDRRDHPRRHQFAASRQPQLRRCRPSAATDAPARPISTMSWPIVRSLSDPSTAKTAKPGDVDGRQGRVRRQLRRLPRRRRQGQDATRAPEPDRQVLDLWRRCADDLRTTLWGGRQGHMPTWEGRLSPLDRKILALYLFDLRRPTP